MILLRRLWQKWLFSLSTDNMASRFPEITYPIERYFPDYDKNYPRAGQIDPVSTMELYKARIIPFPESFEAASLQTILGYPDKCYSGYKVVDILKQIKGKLQKSYEDCSKALQDCEEIMEDPNNGHVIFYLKKD